MKLMRKDLITTVKYGSFHYISRDTFNWIQSYPNVKEESITDRIIYQLNKDNLFVSCVAFTHKEEALNGSDWEWWMIFNKCAYRFRVQAKKLKAGAQDNSPILYYINSNGFQIDLLINRSKQVRALPVYAFYSDCEIQKSFIEVYAFYKPGLKLPNLCSNCKNGIFIASAQDIKKQFMNGKRQNVLRDQLIELSFPLSMLDFMHSKGLARYFEQINHRHYDRFKSENQLDKDLCANENILEVLLESISEYRYTDEEYPPYLKRMLSAEWRQTGRVKVLDIAEYANNIEEYKELMNLSGIVVLDESNPYLWEQELRYNMF